jgi:26 proteasome complex subunit DSS1
MSVPAAAAAAAKAEETKNAALDLDALAEDDEFEEFQEDDWGKAAEGNEEDERLWEDNWDDDDADDGFADQLRKELASSKQ